MLEHLTEKVGALRYPSPFAVLTSLDGICSAGPNQPCSTLGAQGVADLKGIPDTAGIAKHCDPGHGATTRRAFPRVIRPCNERRRLGGVASVGTLEVDARANRGESRRGCFGGCAIEIQIVATSFLPCDRYPNG